jgi:hypothetical protein
MYENTAMKSIKTVKKKKKRKKERKRKPVPAAPCDQKGLFSRPPQGGGSS